jgi:hypothetical protein
MSNLRQLLQEKGKGNMNLPPDDEDIIENEFYGIERQSNRRAIMLDLRMKGGKFFSLNYSYIVKIKFEPSLMLEIFGADVHICIRGRNMYELYNQLNRHKVIYIQENLSDNDLAAENEVFVSEIVVNS